MTDAYSAVDPEAAPEESVNTCETTVRKLTEPLGATELRVNQVVVDPGGHPIYARSARPLAR